MKKLLIVLMVVAVASFLFVGCIPTAPDVDVDVDEEEPAPTPPTTVAPVITSVPDISGGYVNASAAKDGLVVNGTAPTYSEVKVYINGLTAGTGDTEADGTFSVVVANADLIKVAKVDGAKTLYATATETGLTESASSNVKTFTLDTAKPTIKKSSAKAGTPAVLGKSASVNVFPLLSSPLSALANFPWNPVVTSADVVTGTWTVNVTSAVPFDNVTITDPNGDETKYSCMPGANFPAGAPIPGVFFRLDFGLNPTMFSKIVCVAEVAAVNAVPGYIDVTFSEAVTGASILAGDWTAFAATNNLNPTATVRSDTKARLTEAVPPVNMFAGQAYSVSVSGISDLAGNTISASSPSTDTGIIMP